MRDPLDFFEEESDKKRLEREEMLKEFNLYWKYNLIAAGIPIVLALPVDISISGALLATTITLGTVMILFYFILFFLFKSLLVMRFYRVISLVFAILCSIIGLVLVVVSVR